LALTPTLNHEGLDMNDTTTQTAEAQTAEAKKPTVELVKDRRIFATLELA
jgi:hypothetical protein